MLKFTLCFIKQNDRILLLNREYPSWMGAWNGVGGKLEAGETARLSALREIREETGIILEDVHFRGITTWIVEGNFVGGMYLYFAELPSEHVYEVPLKTPEGILDWKHLDWMLHPENRGIANNIPRSIEKIIGSSSCFEHRCYYRDDQLVKDEFYSMNEELEFIKDLKTLEENIFASNSIKALQGVGASNNQWKD